MRKRALTKQMRNILASSLLLVTVSAASRAIADAGNGPDTLCLTQRLAFSSCAGLLHIKRLTHSPVGEIDGLGEFGYPLGIVVVGEFMFKQLQFVEIDLSLHTPVAT